MEGEPIELCSDGNICKQLDSIEHLVTSKETDVTRDDRKNKDSKLKQKTLDIVTSVQSKLDSLIGSVSNLSMTVAEIQKDLNSDDGIDARLQLVTHETDDQTYEISQLKSDNKKLKHEVEILKSYIVRLEQQVHTNQSDILNLTERGMRNNIIITGLPESDSENLREKVNDVIKSDLNLPAVRFDRIHRIGPKNTNSPNPRTVVGKCFDYTEKVAVLENTRKLKNNVRIYAHFPEAHREKRKRSIDVSKQLQDDGIKVKLSGDRVILPGGTLHKEAVCIPNATAILTEPTPKKTFEIHHSDVINVGKNSFQSHAVRINNHMEARAAAVQIMKDPKLLTADHNVLVCTYLDKDGNLRDSVDDNREYGAARKILGMMHDKEIANTLVVVSRWNPTGEKLGFKRFETFKQCAYSGIKKLFISDQRVTQFNK